MQTTIQRTSVRVLESNDEPQESQAEIRMAKWTHVEILRPLFHAATKRLQIAETAALDDNLYLAHLQLKQAKRLFEELQSHLGTIDEELSNRFTAVISYLDCCMRDVDHNRIGFARELLIQRRDIITEIIESTMPVGSKDSPHHPTTLKVVKR
jgi:AraC-like DNA-binding protein